MRVASLRLVINNFRNYRKGNYRVNVFIHHCAFAIRLNNERRTNELFRNMTKANNSTYTGNCACSRTTYTLVELQPI
jgi:hypothetical protein